MNTYNKEEVMKKLWREAVLFAGSDIQAKDTKKMAESISTALDAAYKAGEDARNMKIHKTIVDLPYPRDMYVARHRSEILAAIEALK